MTKLIGCERARWPSDGGVTGKARTPGTPRKPGSRLRAICGERTARSFQSLRPAKEMPCEGVGLPVTMK